MGHLYTKFKIILSILKCWTYNSETVILERRDGGVNFTQNVKVFINQYFIHRTHKKMLKYGKKMCFSELKCKLPIEL